MSQNDYVVCIPSYKRANFCKEKTLATLHKHKIEHDKIYVYVANKEDYDLYKYVFDEEETKLGYKLYNKLVIGNKGLVPQRQFIMEKWPTNKNIVFFDDDIESIDLSLSPKFKSHNLNFFIKQAFDECEKNKAYMWGVYPVFNPFFRKPRPEMSTDLKYIVGAFYGIINRPKLKTIQLTITKDNGQKEDVERTIKYFIEDGIVLRFNKIGFTTKYYGKEGGLGRFDDRLKPMKDACKKLEEKYSEYGHTKVRRNGMTEFVLKKLPAIVNGQDVSIKNVNVNRRKSSKLIKKKTFHNKTKKNK
jgi:cellulose synthase/poly-beta-1,6-N-acetylglucosamine synthase-like glycosyltransferase